RGRAFAPPAGLVLASAELLGLRGELTPATVELQHTVDARGRIRTATGQRGTDTVRIAADQPDVEHWRSPAVALLLLLGRLLGAALRRAGRGRGGRSRR